MHRNPGRRLVSVNEHEIQQKQDTGKRTLHLYKLEFGKYLECFLEVGSPQRPGDEGVAQPDELAPEHPEGDGEVLLVYESKSAVM